MTDGRRLRAVRTRAKILEATLALLDGGDPAPTAAAIAARAAVAVRSIAQHFATRELLLAALAERHLARLPVVDGPPAGPLRERLDRFLAARTRSLEASVALRQVGRAAQGRSRAITGAFADVARRRRAELQATFARELRGAAKWKLEALDVLTSGATWDVLRTTQRQSKAAARAVLRDACLALLR